MTLSETEIAGLLVISYKKFTDNRGNFVKSFQQSKISMNIAESFYSISSKDVIRGMHFQQPPYDHSKLVFVICGKITDVVIDLRKNSKTFGQYLSISLSADNNKAIYIPSGFAHGFIAEEDNTITNYFVSSEYNSKADSGVRWNSFGFDWGISDPIVSDRDQAFPLLSDFSSPF